MIFTQFHAADRKIYKSSYRIYFERAEARAFNLSIFRFCFFRALVREYKSHENPNNSKSGAAEYEFENL